MAHGRFFIDDTFSPVLFEEQIGVIFTHRVVKGKPKTFQTTQALRDDVMFRA